MFSTRVFTTAAAAAAVVLFTLGPAHADETPTPTEPTPVESSLVTPTPDPTESIVTPPIELPPVAIPVPDVEEQADVDAQKEDVKLHSDALPPSPGLTDEYLKAWEAMKVLQSRVNRLEHRQTELRLAIHLASKNRVQAQEAFDSASAALDVAQGDLNLAVRTMYMNNTSQADSLMRALGNSPEDVMRNLDTAMYLTVIGNDKAAVYRSAYANYSGTRATLMAAVNEENNLQADETSLADRIADVDAEYQAARKTFFALVTASKPQTDVDARGCPQAAPLDTTPVDVHVLCKRAVKDAATPQAASALKWALARLGAPYACGGIGRMDPFRFDCSSYVSRAYADGAGLNTAGDTWAPSTRDMVPWDGVNLDKHYAPINAKQLRPGDLVLYDTCPSNTCGYKHVVMYLGFDLMAHTNSCGGVAHIEKFWGTGPEHNFLGARRVMALKGERVTVIRQHKG